MTYRKSFSSSRPMVMRLVFCLALLLLCNMAAYTGTYYIDFQSGNDGNSGTTTSSAWKSIPGTRNAANSAYISASYGGGTISTTNKVPAGTIFMLKPGTTMNSSSGGMVWITSTYYATDATIGNPITLEAYQEWPSASGTVTFDGTGITLGGTSGWGLIHATVGGIKLDGKVTNGITIQDSIWRGVSLYPTSDVAGASAYYCKFYNNGTASTSDSTGASEAQFAMLRGTGGTIDHCEFDGNNQYINGVIFGESNAAVTGYTVSNSNFYNHLGSSPEDDSGAGIKAFNSQITVINCITHDNDKGFDCGEVNGSGRNISYKFVDCTAYNNSMYGMACNGPGDYTYAGTVNFYWINCIVYDNDNQGFVAYSGPFNAYAIHCVSANNGGSSPTDSANYAFWEEFSADKSIYIYIYNSIGYKPGANHNLAQYKFTKSGNYSLTIDSDHNCWRPRLSESFALWDYFGGSGPVDFTYAQGPGSTGTNWYKWYDFAATPSAYGNGHFHCDANSVTSEPPFANAVNHNYVPTAFLPGTSLTEKPWYIAEMGLDRNGRARSGWQMGPYEYAGAIPPAPPAPTRLRLP